MNQARLVELLGDSDADVVKVYSFRRRNVPAVHAESETDKRVPHGSEFLQVHGNFLPSCVERARRRVARSRPGKRRDVERERRAHIEWEDPEDHPIKAGPVNWGEVLSTCVRPKA